MLGADTIINLPKLKTQIARRVGVRHVGLVLSDLSPNISGIASADQARAAALAELARDLAVNYLKPQGNFLVKVFQGSAFDALVRDLRRHFEQVLVRKPQASRSGSSEVYLLAKGCKSQ